MIECCAAPPSDHEPKYTVPNGTTCGDVANTECVDFRGTVCVKGAVWLPPSTAICTPARFDANVRLTVFATILILFVPARPPLSVAVNSTS